MKAALFFDMFLAIIGTFLKFLLLCMAVFAYTTCRSDSDIGTFAHVPFSTEIVVRTAENFRTETDVTAFVKLCSRHHVTVISLLVKQDEDSQIPSGRVYFHSKIAQIAPGYQEFDVLQSMLNLAHPLGIQVRAWVPQFHDQSAVLTHPEWQMMAFEKGEVVPYTGSGNKEIFANPLDPQVQQYELDILMEIAANYPVDGITLDWLRFDNYNMDVSYTTSKIFQSQTGISPLTIDFTRDGPERIQWNKFRTDGIANYAGRVRASLPASLPIGVFILPPEFEEVAQDAGKFNVSVNFLAPMCYFRDWDFPIDWVWNNCMANTANKAAGKAILPTMDSGLSDQQYRQILSHIRDEYPQVSMLSWFHHGQWTENMLERIALMRTW